MGENVSFSFGPVALMNKIEKKFQRDLAKGDKILARINKGKPVGEHISRKGNILLKGEIQTSLSKIVNPYITDLKGYFILESSVDSRPIRHWNKNVVIGYLLIVFLTNCLVKLTHFLSKNNVVKNLKLLKKYLNNLTLTIIYREKSLREAVLSNFSKEMRAILEEKPPNSS